ncbi:uncharacterized protein LOC110825315 isoform X2 [Carica papaya]|uniref:uncharacterized protein LOC110825315 isoform X2 n=1 Tax=Carica papaya TaxID=3649 RepID=UPI000B8CEE13|nr:uncharacterized protein LOC110825315 isoform X2 [Carica papaya]
MFVRKLVEKASKKPGGSSDGLKSSDVDPRVVFHYGIPSGSAMLAYDTIQNIIAISTKDGRIKLFGKDNSQALLECDEKRPSKFLQFIQNQGILLNITLQNQIEVWDIEKKKLSHVHAFKEEITSFAVMQHGLYMYAGDSAGNISVLKLEQDPHHIVRMEYRIPISASQGNLSEASTDTAVVHVLPQPTAESKRILIIFRNGHISLWDIRESKSIFTTGGNMLQSLHEETKKVTSACWVCPFGSKIAVGYSNGDILLWGIPSTLNLKTEISSETAIKSTPICKLNLGFKSEKIPITSLRWTEADRKASRLYALGASDMASTNLFQVVLLNEHTESRTIKLGLQLPELCIDTEIIVNSSEQSKHKIDVLLLLGKSGHIYAYDDNLIEKYLLQSRSRSPPSLPREVMVKIPFAGSTITTAKFISNQQCILSSSDEDYLMLGRSIPSLLHFETKAKDGTYPFSGFTKIKNLYITGHRDGTINFWDVTCPFFIPLLSLKQQTEDYSSNGAALTALYYDGNSRVLLSGDHSGMVCIYKLKPEPYATENSFMLFQENTKKGNNHIIQSLKHIKVKGPVIALATSHGSRHLAVGSDQGYVLIVDIEGPTLLCEKHIASEICLGIISLQFGTCSLQGFEKNVLVVATRDSSVLALDSDNGNMLSTSMVCPKKPSRALFMQILDGRESFAKSSNTSDSLDLNRGNLTEDVTPKQSHLLLCSEKAVYVYSLVHILQGVKRVHQKKKFHSSSCCWASTFCSASDMGLILLFSSGKIEIRSLPELALLKETSIRGFSYSPPKSNSLSDNIICSSVDGDLVMLNGDQELFVMSVLPQKQNFRLSESVGQVYRKDLMGSQECLASGPLTPKEKRKGIFGSVLKDMKGSKTKQVPDIETEDSKESIGELSTIFSTENFPSNIENKDYTDEELELNIDDIDIDNPGEKPKEQNMLAALNKQKLATKLQSFKGKFKQKKVKNEENVRKDEQEDDRDSAVNQIKKKYGFSLSGESSFAKMAESKLHENVKKLQGISLKTSDMQDTARSFSAMAKELLRTAEQDKRS